MIAIVDYGMGNLRSVHKAFEAIGAEVCVTRDAPAIAAAQALVLPGVGAFRDCMANLEALGLVKTIRDFVHTGRPYLGICLGLQLLFEQSEEFGFVHGLGLLPGKVVRFTEKDLQVRGQPLKVPHMGWNTLTLPKPSSLFAGIPRDPYFYFVHSYYVVPENEQMVAATTDYGIEFVSGVQYENIHAFQFHPEKSQKLGLRLLENFARLV
ncbi:MAG: imidazole glycerol phosphate synthase subunit HisH [Nitrospinaceae bacterium]